MKRIIVISGISVVLLCGLILFEYVTKVDNSFRIVFCNVGQGDAIFIKTPGGSDILIDGGPNTQVLSCLEKNMPFWDKTIEVMVLTHPHEDHLQGLLPVLDNYHVLSVYSEALSNTTASYKAFLQRIANKKISHKIVYAGDALTIKDGVKVSFVGPSRQLLLRTSPNGSIAESGEFASIITHVSYKDLDVLLTGDTQAGQLEESLSMMKNTDIDILQVPHHGSKSGLTQSILDRLRPETAVISVGKNRYGHPTGEILRILGDKDIRILRTDEYGSIQMVFDGIKLRIKGKK